MMPPPAGSARPQLPSGDDNVLGSCRASVATLRDLLDRLFPDDAPPDVLRVEEVLGRYRFTGLGAPATAAIEQSRRIIRTRRDFSLMGLTEFHAGLIYLYWGNCHAAAHQFAAARTQWTLAGDIPPGCLSHFAQGVALQHGYHLEAAMSQFGLTTRCLNRKLVGPQATRLGLIIDDITRLLAGAQEAIRPDLWPREAPREVAGPGRDETPPEPETGESAEAGERGSGRQSEPPHAAAGPRQRSAPPRPGQPGRGEPVPPPISNLLREPPFPLGPIPGHRAADDRYAWFVVHGRQDGFLVELSEGTWVLIDREGILPDETVRQMVVFGVPNAGVGSITVRPRLSIAPGVFCYLGYLTPAPDGNTGLISERPLIVNSSDQARRVPEMILLGLVVGFWHELIA